MLHTERWPVVYDSKELEDQIRSLTSAKCFSSKFYHHNVGPLGTVQQGDIISFSSGIPLIWSDANPGIIEDIDYWLVVGNTCDFTRNIEDVPFTQISPIIDIGSLERSKITRSDLTNYKYSRRFYIPPWEAASDDVTLIADFQRIVTIHKSAFSLSNISRVASMSLEGWVLLHCCLVRYLCRDDGRFD
ncbi:MAG: hypothetical protein V7739_03210 [Motiliproteus sp.]